jgi:hypothetical protein
LQKYYYQPILDRAGQGKGIHNTVQCLEQLSGTHISGTHNSWNSLYFAGSGFCTDITMTKTISALSRAASGTVFTVFQEQPLLCRKQPFE